MFPNPANGNWLPDLLCILLSEADKRVVKTIRDFISGVRGRCYRARTQHQAGTFREMHRVGITAFFESLQNTGQRGGTAARRMFSATGAETGAQAAVSGSTLAFC